MPSYVRRCGFYYLDCHRGLGQPRALGHSRSATLVELADWMVEILLTRALLHETGRLNNRFLSAPGNAPRLAANSVDACPDRVVVQSLDANTMGKYRCAPPWRNACAIPNFSEPRPGNSSCPRPWSLVPADPEREKERERESFSGITARHCLPVDLGTWTFLVSDDCAADMFDASSSMAVSRWFRTALATTEDNPKSAEMA